MVEHTELFKRAIGEYTDVVEKEMYTFTDQGGDSLTLRPEATAGIVRAAISNGLLRGARLKLWCQGPMFRHEKPQKGRFRQFNQIDLEAIGFAGPDVDIEIIALTARLWKLLGLTRVKLQINSLGTSESRKAYRALLQDYFRAHLDALDEDGKRRLEGNPLRILDSKHPPTQAIVGNAPVLTEHLDAESQAHFAELRAGLDSLGIRLHGESAPGARPRLLLAHGVRVDHRCARQPGRHLLRRPVRRPDRADWAASHPGHRLCHGRGTRGGAGAPRGAGCPPTPCAGRLRHGAGRGRPAHRAGARRATARRIAGPRHRGPLRIGQVQDTVPPRRRVRRAAGAHRGDDELARGVVALKPLRGAESTQTEHPVAELAARVEEFLRRST